MKKESRHLRRTLFAAIITLLVALAAMVTATFAWYIYNTTAHTTKVRMAAGSSVSLQISNAYDGNYGSSTLLDSFTGLLDPVSTNVIVTGADTPLFQKVDEFEQRGTTQNTLFAKIFKSAEAQDYYKTSLFIRAAGMDCGLYVADIGYRDADANLPISTAIRVGFVVHTPGRSGAVASQYIYAINPAGHNPEANYNTATGEEGYVLDSARTDGTTVRFPPFVPDNYAIYDEATGEAELKPASEKLCDLIADDAPVQVDVYIWLEGCDEDCTSSLGGATLKDVSLSFVGYIPEEKRQ